MPYAEKHYACTFHDVTTHGTNPAVPQISTRTVYPQDVHISPLSSIIIPIGLPTPSRAEKDAILPLAIPVKGIEGSLIDKLVIPAGTSVILPINGPNCDPTLWGPDSLEWKPDRWLSPLPQALQDAHVPGVYSHMYDHPRDYLFETLLDHPTQDVVLGWCEIMHVSAMF